MPRTSRNSPESLYSVASYIGELNVYARSNSGSPRRDVDGVPNWAEHAAAFLAQESSDVRLQQAAEAIRIAGSHLREALVLESVDNRQSATPAWAELVDATSNAHSMIKTVQAAMVGPTKSRPQGTGQSLI